MIYGEGTALIRRPARDILEFVLDFERYRQADTKIRKVHGVERNGNEGLLRYLYIGVVGAVLPKLAEDRARGVGCGPVRNRPRRGGERSSWQPATSSLGRTARGGGRCAGGNFHGMDDRTQPVSGRPSATEACELVPEMGPPPSSSMPWSIQGQRACMRKSGRRWLRVRGPGHTP